MFQLHGDKHDVILIHTLNRLETWRNSPRQSRSLYFEISLYSLACAAYFVEFSWSDFLIIIDALNDDKLCVIMFSVLIRWLLNFDKTYSNHSAIWNNSIWLMMNIFYERDRYFLWKKILKTKLIANRALFQKILCSFVSTYNCCKTCSEVDMTCSSTFLKDFIVCFKNFSEIYSGIVDTNNENW